MLRETEYFMLRNIDRKYINPLFLDGREHPLKHRSGQCFFSPHAAFKTKGEKESRYLFVCKAIYQWKRKKGIMSGEGIVTVR